MAIRASLAILLLAILAPQRGHGQLNNLLSGLNLPSLPSFTLPTLSPLFPPAPCFGTSSVQSGLCRRTDQCAAVGGVEDGNCAAGFGVCCVTPQKCGATSFTNNTIFANEAFPNGTAANSSCAFKVTKLFNVVQLRVEFLSFEVEGPDADGHCSSDAFSVSGANRDFSLRICGKNNGQHVIIPVDASPSNIVTLNFDVAGRFPARWQIKVIQIEASSANRAPANCLQYFVAANGTFSSLNFDSTGVASSAIAGLRYASCFRRVPSACSIRFTPAAASRSRRMAHEQQVHANKYGYVLPGHQYERPLTSYVSTAKRPILRPAHVYRYPLVAVKPHPRPTPFRPPYQSPFESSWSIKNISSGYVPPMAPAHPSGSVVNSTLANTTEEVTNSTVEGLETTTLDSTDLASANSTEHTGNSGYVAPLDDSIPSGFGACVGQDAVVFPPADVLCASAGLRPVTLSVQPFAVYVDNRGSARSNGFSFHFEHQLC